MYALPVPSATVQLVDSTGSPPFSHHSVQLSHRDWVAALLYYHPQVTFDYRRHTTVLQGPPQLVGAAFLDLLWLNRVFSTENRGIWLTYSLK